MFSLPLQITMVYILFGMIVSTYAMTSEKMKAQHELAMDIEKIPKDFRSTVLTLMALLYVLMWPALIGEIFK